MQVRQVKKTMESVMAGNREMDASYAGVVSEYLNSNGYIICVSPDKAFTETLRDVMCTGLGLPEGCLEINPTADMLLVSVRQALNNKKIPLLMIELSVRHHDMTYLVRQLKNGYPEMHIMVITREASEQRMTLLNNSGVGDCLVKPADARAILEKIALLINPHERQNRELKWASVLLAQGEYLQALQVCKKALEMGSSAHALMMIGDVFRAMKQFDRACEAYENASRASSVFLDPLVKLAEVYAETGNTRKRLRCLERLDQLSPMDIERKLAIGELYFQLNLADNARQCFDRAVSLSKREASEYVASVSFRVAEVYMEKDPETAAGFLQRGLEAKRAFWDKEDLLVFNRLGILLRRAGKWQEAAAEYHKAIEISSHDENLYYNLGMAYLEGKDYEKARGACLKALAINPNLPQKSSLVACNIGTVFVHTGDNMHAVPLLRQALELDPANAQAKELLEQIEEAKKG